VSCYSVKSGISGQPEADFHVLYYSIESGISIGIQSNRISICRVTVLSLEFLFVRSNRISMCRIPVLSLESYTA